MTLRSPKKRQITARTLRRRKTAKRLLSRAGLLTAAITLASWHTGMHAAIAQFPHSNPTAPTASSAAASSAAETTTPPGWNLRWRRSAKVAPAPVHVPADDVFERPAAPSQTESASQPNGPSMSSRPMTITSHGNLAASGHATAVAQTGYQHAGDLRTGGATQQTPVLQRSRVNPNNAFEPNAFERAVTAKAVTAKIVRRSAVVQTAHTEPTPVGNYQRGPQVVRANNRSTRLAQAREMAQTREIAQSSDFFNNPFTAAPQEPTPTQGGFQLPAPAGESPAEESPTDGPSNALRNDAGGPGLNNSLLPPPSSLEQIPVPQPNTTQPNTTQPTGPAQPLPAPGDSLRDLLSDPNEQIGGAEDQANPTEMFDDSVPQSPSDKEDPKPFLYQGESNPFDATRDGGGDNAAPRNDRVDESGLLRPRDTSMIRANELSCDEFRDRIARETIDTISLDPSPPFRPDLFDPEDYERQRTKFENRQTARDWTSVDGRVMATGRLIDLAYEHVIVETEAGQREQVPMKFLSEGDLGYLSENWGLPKECLIEQVAFTPRAWTPMTMTWKASNVCSKPRYFEEVNLERYGHTAGPWLQPVVSSAHFFANIAVLPYKMGVHPPGECQYALGYYRPGNCAPWIIPPVPVSARGALSQAAVMTGTFWLVP